MSKEFLSKTIENIQNSTYSWNLYFFRMDKRNNNPFTVYKVKFKNTTYLPDYAKNLLDTTKHFQIDTRKAGLTCRIMLINIFTKLDLLKKLILLLI